MNRTKIISISILFLICFAGLGFYFIRSGDKGFLSKSVNQQKIVEKAETAQDYNRTMQAVLANRIDECNKVVVAADKNSCINSVASYVTDEKMCDLVSDKKLASDCASNIVLKKIISSSTPERCNDLTSPYIETCMDTFSVNFKKTTDCKIFKDSKKCQNIVAHTLAINSRDLKSCDKITDADLRNHCQTVINALPLDSDKDGLSNAQEKSIGTDPFKADTDNDGVSDGQEINVTHTNPKDINSK
ncbi:MAG: thrombospondin type 3 repeat-containing protein [bacterium]